MQNLLLSGGFALIVLFLFFHLRPVNFLPSYTYFIAISFLVSLTVYQRPVNFYLKFFPPFLFLTLIAEVYSSWLWAAGKNNVSIYNFFSTFEFCFYLVMISLIISNQKMKNIIRITCVLYALLAIGNILFIQKMKTFHTTTYAVGCLLIVGFCIYYFLELFRLPKAGKLEYNPAFWICTALLFFYCCGFPLYALINQWEGISKLVLENLTRIFILLNIFLYSLFTIGFLCIRTRKYTLSPL